MKLLIVGGSGHVGAGLVRYLAAAGNEVAVLSRNPRQLNGAARVESWDGRTMGAWAAEVDGADAVINLAGRSVNCRYNPANLKEMMDSRVASTTIVGQAIAQAKRPPKVWLQAATATIYAQRFDAPNDEITGIIGGGEPGATRTWDASVAIAKAWEAALEAAITPRTRKVALRTAMTMSVEKGSVFDVFCALARKGLGGTLGDGKQYVSWIHESDFCAATEFLIGREDLSGAINLCAPNPLPQREFMATLRRSLGVRIGLPASRWMVELGTWAMRTESELVLKSRRVTPKRLLDAGFTFRYPEWPAACRELVTRMR
ncbi:MAG: TIGR01777 family oxidoreductase [Fimbriimonadaceae bacterium]